MKPKATAISLQFVIEVLQPNHMQIIKYSDAQPALSRSLTMIELKMFKESTICKLQRKFIVSIHFNNSS